MEKHVALLNQPSHRVHLFRMMISLLRVYPKLAKENYSKRRFRCLLSLIVTDLRKICLKSFRMWALSIPGWDTLDKRPLLWSRQRLSPSRDFLICQIPVIGGRLMRNIWLALGMLRKGLYLIWGGIYHSHSRNSETYIFKDDRLEEQDAESKTHYLANVSMLQVRALYFSEMGQIPEAIQCAESAYKSLKKATHLRLKCKKEQGIDKDRQLAVQTEGWIQNTVRCFWHAWNRH